VKNIADFLIFNRKLKTIFVKIFLNNDLACGNTFDQKMKAIDDGHFHLLSCAAQKNRGKCLTHFSPVSPDAETEKKKIIAVSL
jgi:hypothetical protein